MGGFGPAQNILGPVKGRGIRLTLPRNYCQSFTKSLSFSQNLVTILSMKKPTVYFSPTYLRRISDHSLQTEYVPSKNFLFSFPSTNKKKIHTSFKSRYLPGLYPPKSRSKSYPKFSQTPDRYLSRKLRQLFWIKNKWRGKLPKKNIIKISFAKYIKEI